MALFGCLGVACADRKAEATRTGAPIASASAATDATAPTAASAPAHTEDPAPSPPAPAHVEALAVPGDLPAAIVRRMEGAPPRVVFLPGICSNAAAYLTAFPEAAARAGGVVAIDGDQPCRGAPGFRTFTFDVDKQHKRIEAALGASGLSTIPDEGVTVVGYSQGAAILEFLAHRYPKRYARIVVIAPPSDPSPGHFAAARGVVTMSCSNDVPQRMKTASKGIAAIGVPSTYLEMPGCMHGNIADGEATFDGAFTWLDDHARAP